jgi:hypothetical protein
MLRLGLLAVVLIGVSAASTLKSSTPTAPVTTVIMVVERQGLPHNAATQLVVRKNLGGNPILFVDTRIATPAQLQAGLRFAQVQHQRLGDKPDHDIEAVPRAPQGGATQVVAATPKLSRMAGNLHPLITHDPVVIKGLGKVRAINIVMQAPGGTH